jgi:predicted nuclease of predicted toxin-antitoxin system
MAGETPDETIWGYAKQNGFAILTSDFDFLEFLERYGPPPKLIRSRWRRPGAVANCPFSALVKT